VKRCLVLTVALMATGCLYTEKDLQEAKSKAYSDGFSDGFAKTRSVTIEVSGTVSSEDGEVEIDETCEVDVSGEDAESACEF